MASVALGVGDLGIRAILLGHESQTICVGTAIGAFGAVFKSEDGGRSFANMTSVPPAQISAVALHPQQEQTVYVAGFVPMGTAFVLTAEDQRLGAEPGPLMRSTDGGGIWTLVNTVPRYNLHARMVTDLEVAPGTPETIYAATHFGLFKTVDGGINWALANKGCPKVDAISVDPRVPSTIHAGSRKGMCRTTDGGNTWVLASMSDSEIVDIAVHPLRPDILYAGEEQLDMWALRHRRWWRKVEIGAGTLGQRDLCRGWASVLPYGASQRRAQDVSWFTHRHLRQHRRRRDLGLTSASPRTPRGWCGAALGRAGERCRAVRQMAIRRHVVFRPARATARLRRARPGRRHPGFRFRGNDSRRNLRRARLGEL